MKRLLKISFDQALMSLTPILAWFCLSLLVDKRLISVFTITYPLQCIYSIIRSPFAIGANISKTRDKNPNAVMTGLTIGIFLSFLFYGFAVFNIDSYISFMNMDPAIYRTFTIYSVLNLIQQTIFSFILDKLYYENRNNLANRYSITFNLLNFAILIGMAIISKNQVVIVAVSIIIMTLYTLYVVIKNWQPFRPQLNLLKCLKYDSSSLASSCFSLVTFLFGISNALEFGAEFGLAITFVSLVTDTQWEVLESVNILAKIDISQKKFNYKKSLRHAYTLIFIIYITSTLMFISLFRFYELNLSIALIYLGFEFFDFFLCPAYYLRTSFLQLNWSASKTTANRIVARLGRFCLSFLPTPFCNSISSIFADLYQIATTKFFFHHNFIIDKNNHIRKRPTKTPLPIGTYRYDDLPIDNE